MKNSGERTIDYRGILEALLSSSMSKLDVESPSVSVITITIEAETVTTETETKILSKKLG